MPEPLDFAAVELLELAAELAFEVAEEEVEATVAETVCTTVTPCCTTAVVMYMTEGVAAAVVDGVFCVDVVDAAVTAEALDAPEAARAPTPESHTE